MLKIALVEDDQHFADETVKYIQEYGKEKNINFEVTHYKDGVAFLNNYANQFNLVFMDIDMPKMSGMQVASELRKIDSKLTLVFLTNLSQYAIKGYEVNALDFILKPINYNTFKIKLDRIVERFENEDDSTYVINGQDESYVAHLSEIVFIETEKHYLLYHLSNGKTLRERNKMQNISSSFNGKSFAFSTRSILINLSFVESFKANEISVQGERLPLSDIYKKEFMQKLTSFLAEEKQ